MNFHYKNCEMNLIDTPGHQDFSEDTYRTLTAVDSALMILDAASGVESQTLKLFEVCHLQKTPVMAFINKMDREGKDPLDLLDEIEKVLKIKTFPMVWPIGMGQDFRGVYHRLEKKIYVYDKNENKSQTKSVVQMDLDSEKLPGLIGQNLCNKLREDITLLEMAGEDLSKDAYLKGELAPVFFGSALNTFGIEIILNSLVDLAPPPVKRLALEREVTASENSFTAFIFKIQANMDAAHRDRVAFMRICSGKFERNIESASREAR